MGFMAPADAKTFVELLERGGLAYVIDGRAKDLVVVDQVRGITVPCDWAEAGTVPWEGDAAKPVGALRLVGSKSRAVVVPPGWKYEGSLTADLHVVPEGWTPEFMDYLRTENGVEVYRDLRTGKEVYVGRARGSP